jgi:hypothetical protein
LFKLAHYGKASRTISISIKEKISEEIMNTDEKEVVIVAET